MHVAECQDIKVVKTSRGDKSIYTFVLLSTKQSFQVWGTKYFEPSVGDLYRPEIYVYAKPYIDKEGRPRTRPTVGVQWVPLSDEEFSSFVGPEQPKGGKK